jgi:hypothetical protein
MSGNAHGQRSIIGVHQSSGPATLDMFMAHEGLTAALASLAPAALSSAALLSHLQSAKSMSDMLHRATSFGHLRLMHGYPAYLTCVQTGMYS